MRRPGRDWRLFRLFGITGRCGNRCWLALSRGVLSRAKICNDPKEKNEQERDNVKATHNPPQLSDSNYSARSKAPHKTCTNRMPRGIEELPIKNAPGTAYSSRVLAQRSPGLKPLRTRGLHCSTPNSKPDSALS